MKVLGVGLSRTGTTSLHQALQILGYKSIHFDRIRLNDIIDGSNPAPNFRRYDDVDAVVDLPAAYFYRELLQVYPDCKAILTLRDVDSWWRSTRLHFNDRFPVKPSAFRTLALKTLYRLRLRQSDFDGQLFRARMRTIVYGSAYASKDSYVKAFIEHNERVQSEVPAERLLVMRVIDGEGWEVLCPFLGVPIPDVPFPHLNRASPTSGIRSPPADSR